MSVSRPDPAPQFRAYCDDCGYGVDPRYSRPTASWEADFHDDLIHDGEEHAGVEEVEVGS